MRNILIISAFACCLVFGCNSYAQSVTGGFYEIGSPLIIEYYVDPVNGNDHNTGRTQASARRSVSSVWNSIPQNVNLTQGIRINLLPGNYDQNHLPHYWENRKGTANAPIILSALGGYGSVFFERDINMAGVSYFYLMGVDIKNKTAGGYGDAFHAERSEFIVLRSNSFNGAPDGRSGSVDYAHETIKFNQSRNVYIENNNIQGAGDNAIDFVAVSDGHIRSNRIHDSQGWCLYVKGGSSYILIEGNLVYNCGEGGITAGQGTGFEFMEAPYLRFEANYIKIVNNIIHDVFGAALGVNGGYNVLLAHNTAYKVGARSHLLEVVFGERTCDGDGVACQARRDAGGWGPGSIGFDFSQPIGNKNVLVFNNIFYNPAGFRTASQHFAIYGPRSPTVSGIPSPQVSDQDLVIKGNLIWNGDSSMPLGIEDDSQGCRLSNQSCNQNQLRAENIINISEPDFVSAQSLDFRPVANGTIANLSSGAANDFSVLESIAGLVREGERSNQLAREFSGAAAASIRPPGAIAGFNSSTEFSNPDSGGTPPPVVGNNPTTIKIKKASVSNKAAKYVLNVNASAFDLDGISSVKAQIYDRSRLLATFNLKAGIRFYSGKKQFKTKAAKIKLTLIARDSNQRQSAKSKTIRLN